MEPQNAARVCLFQVAVHASHAKGGDLSGGVAGRHSYRYYSLTPPVLLVVPLPLHKVHQLPEETLRQRLFLLPRTVFSFLDPQFLATSPAEFLFPFRHLLIHNTTQHSTTQHSNRIPSPPFLASPHHSHTHTRTPHILSSTADFIQSSLLSHYIVLSIHLYIRVSIDVTDTPTTTRQHSRLKTFSPAEARVLGVPDSSPSTPRLNSDAIAFSFQRAAALSSEDRLELRPTC